MMEFKGKRILVTGGHGFLGTPLCNQLESLSPSEIIAPRSKEYDLTREAEVKALFEDCSPDAVIHAAARVGGIEDNRTHPGEIYYKNAMMNTLMVHHAHLNKVQKFVGVGSVCAYPKVAPIPFKEENLWDGYPEETNAPYGMSKKMMLIQIQAYREQYKFPGVFLLPVNLYGPGDHFNDTSSHVISAMIYKFEKAIANKEKKVTLWGDGSPTREFLYVEDAARAISLALQKLDTHLPVNIGSGEEVSIKKLSELVSSFLGYEGEIIWDTSKPNGQPRRLFDSSRANKLMGFEAKTTFEDGLRKTIEWYMKNKKQ
ncbi:GDP-fucose synthetase [Candidatus Micrarchaeota archaeon CG10_big_fil_rev_8_21_14_0_10_45_29]|nr:MAG: GDP-fucose synthetase [Candidatus Micrarchaeota archaeon CG10_big_fil_rev_8_21_14_0_10_45_29]